MGRRLASHLARSLLDCLSTLKGAVLCRLQRLLHPSQQAGNATSLLPQLGMAASCSGTCALVTTGGKSRGDYSQRSTTALLSLLLLSHG